MWPFTIIAERKYRRRYNAAIVVLLGAHVFENLASERRASVEAEVNNNFDKSDTPAIASRRVFEPDAMTAHRAAAMDRLGFDLNFDNLSWSQLLEPWRMWRKIPEFTGRIYDSRADMLLNDYRLTHSATEDAKQLLRDHGIECPSSHAV